MLHGRDFVVLSDDWNGLPTSAIHLFRRLAQQNRVFWFNTIGRLPRATIADAQKVLRTVGAWLRPRRRAPLSPAAEESSIRVMNPVLVPWFKRPVRRFNRRSLLRTYNRVRTRYSVRDPILVTTFPYTADFFCAVSDGPKIYYCVDDFLVYPGVNRRDWAAMERELLHAIDGLVVTSRTLAEKRRNACSLLHLPHGVDFEHFHNARVQPIPEPRMESIPHPIVGFFGLISEWIDVDIICSLSETYPHCSFVLLGRSDIDIAKLKTRPNVHCVGWIPYADLPRYARYFDVGLIPFVQSQLTRAVNPLKLLEYFALGLPVLATRLPELENIRGPLHLARSRAEFSEGLARILSDRAAGIAEEALAVARVNTWDARVAQLSAFLETFSSN
jgi:glycosyltransferase involved in cell wall biosynthesis